MNNFTRCFLVLFRLAVGWLFLFEGIEKVESLHNMPTGQTRPWSSVGYLRESSGPMSDFFHWQAGGDPDEMALKRLAVADSDAPEEAKPPSGDQLSPELRKDFENLVQRYAENYGYDDEQKARAKEILEAHELRMVRWLRGLERNERTVENSLFPTAPYRQSFLARVNAYRDKLAEVARLRDGVNWTFGKDVSKQQLRTAKADAAKMRNELLSEMEDPLKDALKDADKGVKLTDEQKKKSAPSPPEPPAVLRYTDLGISYGLVVIGACLLIGLFTRLNCVAGALFLIMLYSGDALLPVAARSNPKAESHYLFVSKNLIIAIAPCTSPAPAAVAGSVLDGLVHLLNPWRRAHRRGPRSKATSDKSARQRNPLMSLYLTPEQKEKGKAAFNDAANKHPLVTRRELLAGALAAVPAASLSLAAVYYGYESLKGSGGAVKAGLIGAGDEGGVLVGNHNPDFLEFVAYSDIRP